MPGSAFPATLPLPRELALLAAGQWVTPEQQTPCLSFLAHVLLSLKLLHAQRHGNLPRAPAFSFPGSAADRPWTREEGCPGYLRGLAVGKERDFGKRV